MGEAAIVAARLPSPCKEVHISRSENTPNSVVILVEALDRI